jgi:predicted RNA-binding Zn-ribbon protein involved in translation (DUF1610 family)
MSDLDCPDKLEPKTYDTVLAYCQSCGDRIEIPVVHDKATNNQFQLVSIPKEIAYKLENYKVHCVNCGSTNIIERQNHVNRYEVFTIKLDCSNKSSGTDDWYGDSTSSSGDGHPRKF